MESSKFSCLGFPCFSCWSPASYYFYRCCFWSILVRKASTDGYFSFKEAFPYLNPSSSHVNWGKKIWNKVIPPLKSCLFWRLLHNKLPTDDNLRLKGCTVVSICSFCGRSSETYEHLFRSCQFASKLWNWLSSLIHHPINLSITFSILAIYYKKWSSQIRDMVISAVIHNIWVIWYPRNQLRFNDNGTSFNRVVQLVSASTSLSGNFSAVKGSPSIEYFRILKHLSVTIHPPKANSIIQVNWYKPPCWWIKCISDGALRGNPGLAAYRGTMIKHVCSVSNLGTIRLEMSSECTKTRERQVPISTPRLNVEDPNVWTLACSHVDYGDTRTFSGPWHVVDTWHCEDDMWRRRGDKEACSSMGRPNARMWARSSAESQHAQVCSDQ